MDAMNKPKMSLQLERLDSLNSSIVQQEKIIKKQGLDIDGLKVRIADIKEDLSLMDSSLGKELKELKAKLENLDVNPVDEIEGIKTKIDQVKKEMIVEQGKLKSSISNLIESNFKQEEELKKLNDGLVQRLSGSTEILDDVKSSLFDLKQQLLQLKVEIDIGSFKKEELEKANKMLAEKFDSVTKQQEDFKKHLSKLQYHGGSLIEHSNELKVQKHINLRLEDKLNGMESKQETLIAKQQEEIVSLKKLIAEMKQEQISLKTLVLQQIDSQDKSNVQQQGEIALLNQNLYEKTKGITSQLTKIEGTIFELQEKSNSEQVFIQKHTESIIRLEKGLLEQSTLLGTLTDSMEKKIEEENANNKAQIQNLDGKFQRLQQELFNLKEFFKNHAYKVSQELTYIKNELPFEV